MKTLIFRLGLPAGLLFISLVSYSLWSFALTDPNLYLSPADSFVQFQNWMWQNILPNRNLLVGWYLVSILSACGAFLWLTKKLAIDGAWLQSVGWLRLLGIWLVLVSPLLFSSNALSHDIFNYIFNAKMVLVYGANPHVKVALDFGFDNWTRFMHNTHTPAPYWYGWTALSLLPYLLGGGKFVLTWLFFRLYSVLALVLTGLSLGWMLKSDQRRLSKLSLLLLNPLILIEIISNGHNDFFMLLPALWAIWLVLATKLSIKKIILSLILLAVSASTKLATVLLLPLIGWVVLIRLSLGPIWHKLNSSLSLSRIKLGSGKIYNLVWLLASLTLFLPLFLPRSQQFLPWYLSWSLVFVPLFWSGSGAKKSSQELLRLDQPQAWTKIKFSLFNLWSEILLVFSLSALMRYVPWLWQGLAYTPPVLVQQKWIVWGVPLIWLVGRALVPRFWSELTQVASV